MMKQVIVVNESLKLPRGKLAAQVAHASVASLLVTDAESLQAWIKMGMPKVVLAGGCEEDIVDIYKKAVSADVPAKLIRDAGKTILAPGTITCVGLGPAPEAEINKITGQLKLVE
jgi:peptidyl-tRNA hydrolase